MSSAFLGLRISRILTEVELSTVSAFTVSTTAETTPLTQSQPGPAHRLGIKLTSASSPELHPPESPEIPNASHEGSPMHQQHMLPPLSPSKRQQHQSDAARMSRLLQRPIATAGTLRASDIKLLVCLGDSLLTGLCVTAHPSNLKNQVLAALSASTTVRSRIVQWMVSGEHRNNTCISGDGDGVISVGRLLKVFSPDIVGLTQHKTYLFSRGAGFNFARTGSTVDGLADQVHRFVNKLRRPEFRALEYEWKLVYIWIGANDVFSVHPDVIASTFEGNLVRSLQSLRALVSRAYVCLLTLPDLSQAHIGDTERRRQLIIRKTRMINDIIRRVAKNYVWNNTSEFCVVLQPIPADELTEEQYHQFISQLDRVHPNFLAQQLFAKCIWNNLWLPPDRKLVHFADAVEAPWIKPGADDYLV